MIFWERVGQLALDHAFPTSLTPIQIPMRVFDAVRELEGRGDRFFVKRETWSISERTVDWYGFTSEASVTDKLRYWYKYIIAVLLLTLKSGGFCKDTS